MKNKIIRYSHIFVLFYFMGLNNIYSQCKEPSPYWIDGNKVVDDTKFKYIPKKGEGRDEQTAMDNARIFADESFREVIDGILKSGGNRVDLRRNGMNLDSLKTSILFPDIAYEHYFRKENNDTIVVAYVLFKYYYDIKDREVSKIPYDTTFNKQREEYYACINSSKQETIETVSIWTPSIFNQYGSKSRGRKTTGYILAGGMGVGVTTSAITLPMLLHSVNEYNKYDELYKKTSLISDKEEYQRKRDKYEGQKSRNRGIFWSSASVGVVSYLISIRDNCLWNKDAKEHNKKNVVVYPLVSSNYNGIHLIYNF